VLIAVSLVAERPYCSSWRRSLRGRSTSLARMEAVAVVGIIRIGYYIWCEALILLGICECCDISCDT